MESLNGSKIEGEDHHDPDVIENVRLRMEKNRFNTIAEKMLKTLHKQDEIDFSNPFWDKDKDIDLEKTLNDKEAFSEEM
jgi:hypothetical protein